MKTVHIIIKAAFYIFIKVVVVGNPRKMINDRRNESHAHTYYIYMCIFSPGCQCQEYDDDRLVTFHNGKKVGQ